MNRISVEVHVPMEIYPMFEHEGLVEKISGLLGHTITRLFPRFSDNDVSIAWYRVAHAKNHPDIKLEVEFTANPYSIPSDIELMNMLQVLAVQLVREKKIISAPSLKTFELVLPTSNGRYTHRFNKELKFN